LYPQNQGVTGYVTLHQRRGEDTAYVLLYIDDVVLMASTADLLQCMIITLRQEFAMKDVRPLHHFLSITAEYRP
jgi:hypothetical protein